VARKGALAYIGAIALTSDALAQAIERYSERGAQVERAARARLRRTTAAVRKEVEDNQEQLAAESREQIAEARSALERGRDRVFEALHLPTNSSVEQLSLEVARLNAQIDELRASLRRQARAVEEPVPGYDKLNAESVVDLLPSLSEPKLLAVRNHEQTHSNRVTVLRAIDKQLEAKSAA
jgi:poly(hydroxyalkanoate) granule-associated protein